MSTAVHSRRAALTALASIPALALPAVTMAGVADPAQDAELFALISCWNETNRQLDEAHGSYCAALGRAHSPAPQEQKTGEEREGVAALHALWDQAIEEYHAAGQRVAKLKAKTMAGVVAKLLAAAPHVTQDELDTDAHFAVLAGAALDAAALS